MTNEEIRQRAIECGKADLEFCSEHHCDDCCLIDVNPCNHVRAYEHGFADGVEEGKKLANLSHNIECCDCVRQLTACDIKHGHWIGTEYDGYADCMEKAKEEREKK